MNKIVKLALSSIALFSLIACGNQEKSSEVIESKPDSSAEEVISSERPSETFPSEYSSQAISSNELASSDEQSSLPSSSAQASSGEAASSSEQQASSTPAESSLEGTYYHVTFLNYDGTVLYETDVLEGNPAVYVGETPTRPEQDGFTYTFNGWDQDLSSITSDVTTKATFAASDEGWGPIIWF